MANLRYIGPNNQRTILTNRELNQIPVEGVTQAQITQAIDNELADKATGGFVENALSGKLPASSLPTYAEGLLPKTTVNNPSGPVSLSSGRVSNSYMPTMSGGKTWRFLGSVPSWSSSLVSELIEGNGKLISTWSLPNIGYSYIPIFTGSCQIGDTAGGELQVRYASRTGDVFARAVSGNTARYDSCPIIPTGGVRAITSGTFYVVVGKKFSGGANSALGGAYSLSCFAVPA